MTRLMRSFAGLSSLLAMLLLGGSALAQEPPPSTPGTVQGVGTRFDITDSDYLNLTVETTDAVSVRLVSIPELILLDIAAAEGATSTQVSISGLPPLAVMHRYLDSLGDHEPMTADELGRVTWTQDLSQSHLVILKPTTSTIYLDLNGWSDPTVGTWDPATLTGTLTQDVTETIEIRAGVTLDGAGHSVTTPKGIGVNVSDRYAQSGITVRNVVSLNAATGILARAKLRLAFSHNTIAVGSGGYGMDIGGEKGPYLVQANDVHAFAGQSYKVGIGLSRGIASLESNTVTDADHAFDLINGSSDTLKYNTISAAQRAYYLVNCNNVLLFNNYCLTKAAASVSGGSGNRFYLDPPIGGNYWADLTAPDANGDGFVDKEYRFSGGTDLYPLTTAEPRYFTITASSVGPGSILPSGAVQVLPGASQRFDFMPEVCSVAKGLRIDPGPKPIPPEVPKETSYTFRNVWKSHTIEVTFGEGNQTPSVAITGPASGSIFAVGTPVPLTGHFDDGDVPAQTHTAQWSCDGVAVPGVVDELTGAVTGSYTFTAAGVYGVSLTVSDQCGGSETATTVDGLDAMIVVYDPNAGFVTGGGWISSPAGAYAADPALTGKANFGFVSKYQKGASVPTGETEFQFRVAGLNFHSASYDWMVIAGPKAQYKGAGTINGAGDYGFMLTATDGNLKGASDPDRFRIKITDRSTGALVYDNQLDAPDGADPTTALGGGSVVIHTNTGGTKPTGEPEAPLAPTASLPTVYSLFAARPNPFQASTIVSFDLPRAGQVSLNVYDASGRHVKTLAREAWPAGHHELAWSGANDDGRRVAAGVYFYRITVQPLDGDAAFTSLRRMVFVK